MVLGADTSVRPRSAETLRDDLKSAIKREDRPTLEKLIQECERTEYPEIGFDIQDARLHLKRLGGGYGGQILSYCFNLIFISLDIFCLYSYVYIIMEILLPLIIY